MKRNSKIIIFFSIVVALTLFVCATMTLLRNKRDDFKKIFPEAIISTHLPKMSDKNRPKRDRPITTITFNNGEQIVVEFKKKYKGIKQYFKQEYVVDNFYEIGAFRIE